MTDALQVVVVELGAHGRLHAVVIALESGELALTPDGGVTP